MSARALKKIFKLNESSSRLIKMRDQLNSKEQQQKKCVNESFKMSAGKLKQAKNHDKNFKEKKENFN